GGGPLPLARRLAAYMRQHQLVPPVIEFNLANPTGQIGTVAGIGSPAGAVGLEDPFTEAPLRVVKAMEQALNRSFDYLIPGETGPMNSLIPMLAAAQLGVPLIDADGAGRAMSTLGMSTFNQVAKVSPYILGNESTTPEHVITAHLAVNTPDQADSLTRSIVSSGDFGSSGAFSTWPSTVGVLSKVAVSGSVGLAVTIGEQLQACQAKGIDPIAALQTVLGRRMRCLYTGQVKSVELQTTNGFDSVVIKLQSPAEPDFILYALNENMIGWYADQSQPACIGPDSLCYVTTSGVSFTNATIAEYVGKPDQIHIVGLQAEPALLTPGVLAAYADVLGQLGYAGPYRPLVQEKQ
ncbi:MAG: DUF917 family protein, partial [Natronospirillum sp.]